MMLRVFLTHTPTALSLQFPPTVRTALARHCDLVLNPTDNVLAGAALARAAAGCDLVIADRQTAIDKQFFESSPDTLAVMRCAVDISTIDVDAASQHGVLVTRSIPTFATSVSELALGFIIDGARGISRAVAGYRSGQKPSLPMGNQISGQTLGICGFGVIGRQLATMGQALGMKVIITDPAPGPLPDGITDVAFDTLLGTSDFVVCLAPSTPQTAGMFGTKAFSMMKPTAMLINLARGELVDEAALEQALDKKLIACAAMDVGSAADQCPAPCLASREDVIATPHIGGQTPQASEGQAMHVVSQVIQLAQQQFPDEAVNVSAARRLHERFAAPSSPRIDTSNDKGTI
ncbi:NAD(P)-dependent oxidoreductase [Thalassospira lucentensis]|uniref:NAD(P)-dependent oxidoreductase n=1 Tax=Thalassospira lucentensis TaxID=168935 RepID=UPI003D2F4397